MINKEKKCKATIPELENDIDYRQRMVHYIIAKFTGQQTVLSAGNEIYFTATEEQEVMIQSLIDTCLEELDEVMGHMVYSFMRRKNLVPASEVKLTVKKIA